MKRRLRTAYYNSGTSSYQDITTNACIEMNFISATIDAKLNEVATASVILADSDGSMSQKYDTGTNAVYVGSGRVQIEEPIGTCIFDGRIIKARHVSEGGRVILTCRGWLHQLTDERAKYDMREDLDGSGLRESQLHTDPDNATYIAPVYTDTVPAPDEYFMYDDDMNWADNLFNDKYVVFNGGMAGKIKVGTGPYSMDDDSAIGDANPEWCWVDDTNGYLASDAVADFHIDANYRVLVSESNFFDSGPTAARLHVSYYLTAPGVECQVRICNNFTVLGFADIGELKSTTATTMQHETFTVPTDELANILKNTGAADDGEAEIRFSVTRNGVNAALKIFYCWLEVDVETSQCSEAFQIQDCDSYEAMKLEVDTDLTITNADMGLWEGCPYSIIRPIFMHIASDETPGTLITGGCPLVMLTCAGTIERTSGLTSRNFKENTRFEMLRELALMDKAVFYVVLGTTTLTYKSTFNATPTALGDHDVLYWSHGEYDYVPMFNEFHLYGIRIGDEELYVDTADLAPDPGAASKTKYGVTKSDKKSGTGAVSKYELDQLGAATVTKDKDVNLFLRAELAGLSSLRRGSEVAITSVRLGLSAANYVVTDFSYSTKEGRTRIRLHPHTSQQGFIDHMIFGEKLRHAGRQTKRLQVESEAPSLM